jgi:hypothetical protein
VRIQPACSHTTFSPLQCQPSNLPTSQSRLLPSLAVSTYHCCWFSFSFHFMSTTLELGRLRLVQARCNLHLDSCATATFAYHRHLGEDGNASHPDMIDRDCIRQSWVKRGSGLQFEIVVRVNGQPLPDPQLHELGQLVSSAQVYMSHI